MTVEKDQKSNPEKQPKSPEAKPEAKPLTGDDKSFVEQVDAKSRIYGEKLEELKKRFGASGSVGEKTGEIMVERQKARINRIAHEKKSAFIELAAEEKAKRLSIMMGDVESEMNKIYFPFEKIIDYVRGLDKVDDAELVKLEAMMDALTKMQNNPQAEEVFMKILRKQELKKEDYQKIIALIKPVDMQKAIDQKEHHKILENSEAGAIISALSEGQKVKLIETMVQTLNTSELIQVLEVFLASGIITNLQLDDLVKKGKLPAPVATELQAQINNGQMAKKQQVYTEKVDRLTRVNEGRTAENPLNKTVGGPALLALGSLWGAATALINFQIHFNPNDPIKSAAEGLSNPYTLLGLATVGASAYGMYSIVSPKGAAETKQDVVEFFSGPEVKEKNQATRREQINKALETNLSQNIYLMDFLGTPEKNASGIEKTGLEIINDFLDKFQKEKKTPELKFTEIRAAAGPKQQELLDKALGLEGSTEINFKQRLDSIMSMLIGLELNKKDKYAAYVQELRRKQNPDLKTA